MNKLISVLLVTQVFNIGCAQLKTQLTTERTKKFELTKSWARHTPAQEYLRARINHVMEPVLYADMVIAGNEIDGLTAYNMTTGNKIWTRYFNGGVTASGKIHKGILFFGAGDGFFYAIEPATGKTKWSFPIRAEGISAPVIENDVVYFQSGNNQAFALKADTGEQVWLYTRIDNANLTVRGASEPTVVGERVYLGFSDGFLVALDRAKGSVVWEKQLGTNPRFRDVDSKPVHDNGKLYVSSYDGQLYCLNLSGQTEWVNDDGGFTPVTISGNNVYYSTSSRKVVALEKSSGKVLWTKRLKETVAGQPVVHRGLLMFGEWSGSLRAVDALTGQDVAAYNTGRGVTARPAVHEKNDRVFIMTADANLFSFNLQLNDPARDLPWE